MLTFRPISEAEPRCIAKARATLADAPRHPDADEIAQALDVLSHALMRLGQIGARMCHAEAREAVEASDGGAFGALEDAVSDLAYAVECWASDPCNDAAAMRAADRADFLLLDERASRS